MDFDLTHEQELIVSTVRGFVESELYPHESEVERTGRVPRELGLEIASKVRAPGFFAPNLPVEVGGGGLTDARTRDEARTAECGPALRL